MKYTIHGFSQEKMFELQLDLVDAMILRWFVDFKDSNSMYAEVKEGKVYYWLKYENLLNEIPMIYIKSKDVLRKRLKKLVEKEVLIHYTKKEGGTFSFYNVGNAYSSFISSASSTLDSTIQKSEGTIQKSEGYDSKIGGVRFKNRRGYDSKVGTKNYSFKDSSIKDSSIKDNIYTIFEKWNKQEIIKHTKVTKEIEKAINKALKNYEIKEITKGIENYSKVVNDDNYFFNYSWNLVNFLNRKGGLAEFIDDGSKWINYLNDTKSQAMTGNTNNTGGKEDTIDILARLYREAEEEEKGMNGGDT